MSNCWLWNMETSACFHFWFSPSVKVTVARHCGIWMDVCKSAKSWRWATLSINVTSGVISIYVTVNSPVLNHWKHFNITLIWFKLQVSADHLPASCTVYVVCVCWFLSMFTAGEHANYTLTLHTAVCVFVLVFKSKWGPEFFSFRPLQWGHL